MNPEQDRPTTRHWPRLPIIALAVLVVLGIVGALAWANRPDAAIGEDDPLSQPAALLEVNADEDWTQTKAELYFRTQLQFLKSPMVVNAALRDTQIARLPVLPGRRDDKEDFVRGRLLVDRPGEGEVIRVRLAKVPADQAAKIINAVADAYLREIVDKEREDALDERNKLQGQVEQLDRRFVQHYQTKVRLEVQRRSAALTAKLARAALDDFIKERSELTREARKLVRQIKHAKARVKDAAPEGLAAVEEELKFLLKSREELQSELSERAAELAKLESTYSPEYLRVSTNLDDLAAIQRELSRQLYDQSHRLDTWRPRVRLLVRAVEPIVP